MLIILIRYYDASFIYRLQKMCKFVAEKVLRCYFYSHYQTQLTFLTLRNEIHFNLSLHQLLYSSNTKPLLIFLTIKIQ